MSVDSAILTQPVSERKDLTPSLSTPLLSKTNVSSLQQQPQPTTSIQQHQSITVNQFDDFEEEDSLHNSKRIQTKIENPYVDNILSLEYEIRLYFFL